MSNILFTPAAVLDLLTQIDELSDINISVTESGNSQIDIEIGDSLYHVKGEDVTNIKVSPEAMEDVEDANQSAYEQLETSGQVDLSDPIESGIIKEIAKTLLVGGLVRIAGKLLK